MFLLHKISHMLDYIDSKIEKFFYDLTGDYSEGTLLTMAIVFFWAIDFPAVYFSCAVYGLDSPKGQQIMQLAVMVQLGMSVIFGIITAIMENIFPRVAYYTRAIVLSFLAALLMLVMTVMLGSLAQ